MARSAARGGKKKLNVAIIGLGWPSERHLRGYGRRKEVRLAAICDLSEERRRRFREQHGLKDVEEFEDYGDLLKKADVGAVSVCLPNYLHAPAALAALKSGRHVLVEKPPFMKTAEARLCVREAERRRLHLMYVGQRRFLAETELAKKLIAKGRLGEVYHAEVAWRRTSGIPIGAGGWFVDKKRAGGGAFFDIGVHMLDLVWYLLGCPRPVAVQGAMHSKFSHTVPKGVKCDVDDFGVALFLFEGGRSALVQASWALQQKGEQQHYCTVYGTKAGLSIWPMELYSGPAGNRTTKPLAVRPRDGFPENVAHFADVVLGKAKPITTREHALQMTQMLEGAYTSARTGKPARV